MVLSSGKGNRGCCAEVGSANTAGTADGPWPCVGAETGKRRPADMALEPLRTFRQTEQLVLVEGAARGTAAGGFPRSHSQWVSSPFSIAAQKVTELGRAAVSHRSIKPTFCSSSLEDTVPHLLLIHRSTHVDRKDHLSSEVLGHTCSESSHELQGAQGETSPALADRIQQPARNVSFLMALFGTSGDCSSALVKDTKMLRGVFCIN